MVAVAGSGAWQLRGTDVEPLGGHAEQLAQADGLLASWIVRAWQHGRSE